MQPLFFVRLNANNIFLGVAFSFTRHTDKKQDSDPEKSISKTCISLIQWYIILRFVSYIPTPTFFQSLAIRLGFNADVNFVSTAKVGDNNILEKCLTALIYLSRSPGLDKLELRFGPEKRSCTVKVKNFMEM